MAKEGKLPMLRPQDKHLTPFNTLSPEEAKAIRSKGGKARQKQIRERMELHEFVRAFMTLGTKADKPVDPAAVSSLAEAREESIPVVMDIIMTEYDRYKETGDKESRDFLLRLFNTKTDLVGTHGNEQPDDPKAKYDDSGGIDVGGGVRIHLIRGEKPVEQPQPSDDAATQESKTAETGDDPHE